MKKLLASSIVVETSAIVCLVLAIVEGVWANPGMYLLVAGSGLAVLGSILGDKAVRLFKKKESRP